jgi:hypothetical protein
LWSVIATTLHAGREEISSGAFHHKAVRQNFVSLLSSHSLYGIASFHCNTRNLEKRIADKIASVSGFVCQNTCIIIEEMEINYEIVYGFTPKKQYKASMRIAFA